MPNVPLIAMIFALALGSAAAKAPKKKKKAPPPPPPDTLVVTMERKECYGSCPVYKVDLYASGKVVYRGKRYVKQTGLRRWTVKPQAVKRIRARADSIGLAGMRDRYDTPEDGCLDETMDDFHVELEYRSGDQAKKIFHNHGCSGPLELEALEGFERYLDSTLQTSARVGPPQIPGEDGTPFP